MTYFRLENLSESLLLDESQQPRETPLLVTVQARLHHLRKKGNLFFIILRENLTLIQVMAFKKALDQEIFRSLLSLPRETILQVTGEFRKSPFLIETTQNHFEIHLQSYQVISLAIPTLEQPLQVENLDLAGLPFKGDSENNSQSEDDERPIVSLHHRLNHRVLDLRSRSNQVIFRLKARIESLVRQYFESQHFVAVSTPKLINIPSESGAQVFPVQYFGQTAYLAQSPQLYKQMLINADFHRVYEIGPVYRAERSFSHRHLCEFTGLDFEMELEEYYQPANFEHFQDTFRNFPVYKIVNQLFQFLATHLAGESSFIENQPQIPSQIPVLTFAEGVEQLSKKLGQPLATQQDPQEDLNHEGEQVLGQLVAEEFKSDLFFLIHYPSNLRPFYTALDPTDPKLTLSYDLIFRGQEIASGAIREHRAEPLADRMKTQGLTLDHYRPYLNSFRWGSPPHAGLGIGLERLVALYLNFSDVRQVTLFPRDPHRLSP